MARMLPVGTTLEITEESIAGKPCFRWMLKRMGTELARGQEWTKKKAEDEGWKKIRDIHAAGETTAAGKNKARIQLKYLTGTRPYLVAAVLELLLETGSVKTAIEDAAEFERAWHQKDSPEFRRPLPTHGRALSPPEAAKRAIECFTALGMMDAEGNLVGNRLRNWGANIYGKSAFGKIQAETEEIQEEEQT